MTLTRKDLYATLAVWAGILLAASVVEGWGWPLMNGVRMGILALLVLGAVACSVSGWATGDVSFSGPFKIGASIIGGAALLVALIGLFTDGMAYLVIVMGALAALWVITTVDRMLGGSSASRPAAAA